MQSHLEFARELTTFFTRWYCASDVEDFEGLCDLIVLEQLKNSVPVRVATYISEQKAKTAAEAAALADDFVLTHRGCFGESRPGPVGGMESGGWHGSEEKVLVTILRDTGAFNSFIQAGVLPLSNDSQTGSSVPVRGMDLNVLFVPVHKVMLDCELFQGEAELAVRPALPIRGIHVILGNDLVGVKMWAEVLPPAGVVPESLVGLQTHENEHNFPETYTACAVTRTMATLKSEALSNKENVSGKFSIPLSNFSVSISRSDLVAEQQADPSLKVLFEQVRPESEVLDSACDLLVNLYGSPTKINKLQYIQNSAARMLTFTRRRDHITPVFHDLHWLPVEYRIHNKILLTTYKAMNNLATPYLLLHPFFTRCHPQDQAPDLGRQGLFGCYTGTLSPTISPQANTLPSFKQALKIHLFKQAFSSTESSTAKLLVFSFGLFVVKNLSILR
ncbi:hypothetical protein N1851_023093 [Merluccius polli]|uniref:SCAN box domain-containing protein n=1 Tax=Merluccius polli TaxID=89951 RepID=A0AA47NVC0_MERPO|nr:hypothetical protein N1851_023093 [Merluccius polli]